jgi:hypothetical protein
MQILLWPLQILWRLVTLVLGLTSRLVMIVLGLAILAAGWLLSLTGIGAVIGLPLMALGFLLLVRGVF